jgi:type IV pilus assembly protein PilP
MGAVMMRAVTATNLTSRLPAAKMGQTTAATTRSRLAAAVLLGTLGAAACGDDEPPPPPPKAAAPSPVPGAPAPGAEAAAAGETPTVYTYNAVGKRDPFRTYFAEAEEADDANKNQSELQRFDIDQLKLVGVIVGTATPTAMVEDPAGQGHVVRVGTLMGKHWGQVKHIRRGEIIIQEEFRDFTGRRVSHLVPLRIPEEEIPGSK